MKTSIQYCVTRPRGSGSIYAVNGVEPVAIWDFAAGQMSAGFAVTRDASAYGYDSTGRLASFAPHTVRLDSRGPLRTALLEPESSNLLSHATAHVTTGWSANGASAVNTALNALGLFPGVTVSSSGAIWHRLDHTGEIAVLGNTTYHLRVFCKFGSSTRALITIRDITALVESRVEFATSGTNVLGAGAGPLSSLALSVLGVDDVRCLDLNFTPDRARSIRVGIGPGSSTAGANVTLLGAQLETATAGSSFIASAGAATTRPADIATWAAPPGLHDLRMINASGSAADTPSVNIGAGWSPAALPFSPAVVLLFPAGTL